MQERKDDLGVDLVAAKDAVVAVEAKIVDRLHLLVMACAVMACIVMACIFMACIVMAYAVVAYVVMAYAVMAYIVMAYGGSRHGNKECRSSLTYWSWLLEE